jgi:hypothetical protein
VFRSMLRVGHKPRLRGMPVILLTPERRGLNLSSKAFFPTGLPAE